MHIKGSRVWGNKEFHLDILDDRSNHNLYKRPPFPQNLRVSHLQSKKQEFGGISMAKGKPHLNLVFIGHVDAGKSTTVGRLLYDSGNIDEQAMRKLKEKAEELGKGGFEFAFVMDNLKEERERGVTIDLAHKKFDTPK